MRVLPPLLAALVLAGTAAAAGYGKLAGRVTLEGRAVPGAHVAVEGSGLGAATDLQGRYVILRLPPGNHRARVSHVGMEPRELPFFIISDQTTVIDVELEEQWIEIDELRVMARRIPLPLDRTSRMAVVDGERMRELPVEDLRDVLTLQAGITSDASGRIHVRGGRHSELKYLVDGVEVDDPLSGSFEGLVNEDAVNELVLVAGTFSAEYGGAMSGVVNIVTRGGSEEPRLSLRYRSPSLVESPWRRSDAFDSAQDELAWSEVRLSERLDGVPAEFRLALPGRLNMFTSGPLPGGLLASLTAFSRGENSHLPHGYKSEGDLALNLKHPTNGRLALELGLQHSRREYQEYSHVWKYLPLNQSVNRRGTRRYSLGLTQELNRVTYYSAHLSYVMHDRWKGVLREGEELPLNSYARPVYREQQDFYREGTSSYFEDSRTRVLGFDLDLTRQWGMHHEVKTGFDYRRSELTLNRIHNVWGDEERLDDSADLAPLQGSAYLQDKVELDYLVLNLGLRLDWRDPDAVAWEDLEHPFVTEGDSVYPAPDVPVNPQWALSPRLGLAFPVTDRSVLHASYGHFLQFAPYYAMYTNLQRNIDYSRTPLFGNPAVKPQKTVAYEIGLNRQLESGGQLSVTAWYKDLTDLLSTVEVIQYTRSMMVYSNTDYANVRGVDLAWSFPLGSRGDLSLDYTWMVARGNAAEPESGLIRVAGGEEVEFNEFPLDYEQRHDLTAVLRFEAARGVSLQALFQAGSGLPYTPFIDIGVDVPTNTAVRPWTYRTDLSLRWKEVLGYRPLELWLEVDNLFDRRNVIWVYPSTGDPFEDPRGLIGSTPDALHDPSHVEAPRTLRLGFQVSL